MSLVFPADAISTCSVRLGTYLLGSVSAKVNDNQHRHPDPQRPRRADREAAGVGSDGIVGGHAVRIPRAAVGMNASRRLAGYSGC